MDNLTMLTRVLEVAALTEDRAPDEQRAMLNLALVIDMGRGAFVNTNHDLLPPTMVAHVEATYSPSSGRHIGLTTQQREKYERLRESWTPCSECGWPNGTHFGNDDPARNHPTVRSFARAHRSALQAWRDAREHAAATLL